MNWEALDPSPPGSPPLTPTTPVAEKAYLANIANLVGRYVGEAPSESNAASFSASRDSVGGSSMEGFVSLTHGPPKQKSNDAVGQLGDDGRIVVVRRYLPPALTPPQVQSPGPVPARPLTPPRVQSSAVSTALPQNTYGGDDQYRFLNPWDAEWWPANAQSPILAPPMHDLQMALRSWDASYGVAPLAVEPPMPLLFDGSPVQNPFQNQNQNPFSIHGNSVSRGVVPPPFVPSPFDGLNSIDHHGVSGLGAHVLASKPSVVSVGTDCAELQWETALPVAKDDLVIDCIIEYDNPLHTQEEPTRCVFENVDRPRLVNGSHKSWRATVRQLRPHGAEYRFRVVPVVGAGKLAKPSRWSDIFFTPTAPKAPTAPLATNTEQPDWLLADEGVIQLQWSVATPLGGSSEVHKCEVQQKLFDDNSGRRGHASIDRSSHAPVTCDFVMAPRMEERRLHSALGLPELIWICTVRVSRQRRAGSLAGRAYWCFRVRVANGVDWGPWGGWSSPASPVDVQGRSSGPQRAGQFRRTNSKGLQRE